MTSRCLPAVAIVCCLCLPGTGGAADPIGEEYRDWERQPHPEAIPGSWRFLGPESYVPGAPPEAFIGGLGRVLDVAVHPEDPATLFVATAGSGVWKTARGGGRQTGGEGWLPLSRWIPLTNGLKPVPAVTSIAIDPDAPDTIYALTGRGHPLNVEPIPSSGVLKTTDGGNDWTYLPLPWQQGTTHFAQKVMVNRTCGAVFVVGWSDVEPGFGGIYRSFDGGKAWERLPTTGFQGSFRDLEIHPTDPSVMYAATDQNVIRLEKCGDVGTILAEGLPTPSYTGSERVELAVSPASPETVYALYAASYGFAGIYRSDDRGKTFTRRSTAPNILGIDKYGSDNSSIAWFALGFAVSPCNAEEVHVGSYNAWRSMDGGTTWNRTSFWQQKDADAHPSRYLHVDIQRLLFVQPRGGCAAGPAAASMPTLYALSDGGISTSADGGESWYDLSTHLAITQVYRLCGSGADLDLLYAGCQDIGTNRLVNGVAINVYAGDGAYCMIDPEDRKTVYVSYQYGRLFRSRDGARSFVDRTPSPYRRQVGGRLGILWPFVLEPGRPDTIYGCYPGLLWQSQDRGDTWSQLGSALPQSAGRCAGLAVSEGGKHIFVAKSDNVYRLDSLDRQVGCGTDPGDRHEPGRGWCRVTPKLPAGTTVASIEIFDRTDVEPPGFYLYVLYEKRGHEPGPKQRASGIRYSRDYGNTWVPEDSGDLPDIPANTLRLVKKNVGGIRPGLYLAMDIGVFSQGGREESWRQVGEVGGGEGQLPAVPVMAIDYQTDGKRSRLRVGTLGQGIWEFIPEPEPVQTGEP